MRNKLFLIFILGIMLLTTISALDDLGSTKVNEPYRFCQVCADATYINLSTIQTPSTTLNINSVMVSSGAGSFCYNYTPSEIGRYDFMGISDGCEKSFATYIQVTPSGLTGTLGFFIVILLILAGIITLGFAIKDGWFVVLGGMGLIIFGIYSITNGIAGFRDPLVTWGINLMLIGIGTYLAIRAGLEIADEV